MRNASTASYPSPHGTSTRVVDLRPRRRGRGVRRWDGTAWVAGFEFTGLNSDPSLPYVWCDRSIPSAYESATGYLTIGTQRACPANIEIFEKTKLVEPPHVPGM